MPGVTSIQTTVDSSRVSKRHEDFVFCIKKLNIEFIYFLLSFVFEFLPINVNELLARMFKRIFT